MHRHYPESRYGNFSDVDGTIRFYVRVRSLVCPQSVVLDVGCGRGAFLEDPLPFRRNLQHLKGDCERVVGIDVDPAGHQNSALDEFRLIDGQRWPIEDSSVDVLVSDWVVEHVQDPEGFFSECRRVVKVGGHLCLRTANALSYIGLASRAIPERLQGGLLGRLQPARSTEDVFPTVYRCNTAGRLRKAMESASFASHVYGHHPEPTYLTFSPLAYQLGVWQQRVTPRFLAVTLLGFGRKPGLDGAGQAPIKADT